MVVVCSSLYCTINLVGGIDSCGLITSAHHGWISPEVGGSFDG